MSETETKYWIVVVDDDTLCLTNARKLLNDDNMRVSCLKSGADLLKFIEKNTPDLILLDIIMPKMDGFETFNALRQYEDDNDRAHIPVIFLTGENDSDMERRGLKIGASDFIRKPFNKDIVTSRIYNTIINTKTIETLTEEATVDKMTGFLNKASGISKVTALCEESSGALIVFDLDNFKLVNDMYGHDMGDRVLEAFSDILRRNTREYDVLSRIGGDEFMAFFKEILEAPAVASLSDRLNNLFALEIANLMGPDNGLPLGISMGVVMVPEYGRDYPSLFALADSALYSVKQNGKHGYDIYDHSGVTDINDEQGLEKEIERITRIIEERNETDDALLLGREAFAIAYRFVVRFYKEYGGIYTKVIYELRPEENADDHDMPAASARFEKLLKSTLNKSDLIMQNRVNQFCVLITNRDEKEAEAITERLLKAWDENEQNANMKIQYAVKFCEEQIR